MQISHCFKTVTDIKKFNIETFASQVLELLNPISLMLMPAYSKKLWKAIYEHFCTTYVIMLFALSTQYTQLESRAFAQRVELDNDFLAEVFSAKLATKELVENTEFIHTFELCLTDPIEEVIVHLVKLSKRLKEDFGDNCIVRLA